MFTREQLASEEGIGSAVASTSVIVKAFPAVDTSIVQIDHFRIMRPNQFHDRTSKSTILLVEAFDHTLIVAHSVAQDLSNSMFMVTFIRIITSAPRFITLECLKHVSDFISEIRAPVTKVGMFFAIFHEIGNVVFQNGILGIECQFCNWIDSPLSRQVRRRKLIWIGLLLGPNFICSNSEHQFCWELLELLHHVLKGFRLLSSIVAEINHVVEFILRAICDTLLEILFKSGYPRLESFNAALKLRAALSWGHVVDEYVPIESHYIIETFQQGELIIRL